jgi:hypothetical protein
VTYDAAKQYQAMLDECRAGRRARRQLGILRDETGTIPAAAVSRILREWDAAPKAILGHEQDPAEGEL